MKVFSAADWSRADVKKIYKLTDKMKQKRKGVLKGEVWGLLFEKPSTRTRISFECALSHLSAQPIFLSPQQMQTVRGETLADTARILSLYLDGLIYRGIDANMRTIGEQFEGDMINALTEFEHPCQALADFYTMIELMGGIRDKKIVFVGDGSSNVCHSLILLADRLGVKMWVVCPSQYAPLRAVVDDVEYVLSHDVADVEGADIVYTDVWVSMGQEAARPKKIRALRPYQVNQKLMALAPDALFMHCLPAHRGMEVTADVIDGPRSIVWKQAANRLPVQKGLLAWLRR